MDDRRKDVGRHFSAFFLPAALLAQSQKVLQLRSMTRLTLAVWTLLLLPVAAQYRIRGYEPTSLPSIAVICNCFVGVLGSPRLGSPYHKDEYVVVSCP